MRQRDRVHARCIGYVGGRLRRAGWETASEVEIIGSSGSGWIDVVGFHPPTGILLVIEIKTEIHDLGRIQRTLGWYETRGWAAANRRGWRPRLVLGALLVLDTRTNATSLRANRELALQAFAGRATELAALIEAPRVVRPGTRFLATFDPVTRRRSWMRPTVLDGRRTAATYRDYAEIARRFE
jgi:hypothetical protein